METKYKILFGFIGTAIFVFAIQCGVQFIQAFKFVGFEKRDQSTWIGLAEVAQADKLSCLEEVDQLKKARDEANKDIQ